jgi:hypothetical protein
LFDALVVIKIQNDNPEMLGEANTDGWINCPNCGIRFKLTDTSRWKKRRHTTCGQRITFANRENKIEPLWCVVANIAEDISFGEEHRIQKGTKHFSPGTKVYCCPPLWGDGYENIKVVARHRGSKQFVTMIVRAKWLTNCRAKLVYNPHILNEISNVWDGSEKSKNLAENLVQIVSERNHCEKKPKENNYK